MELELQCSASVQEFLCAQQAFWLPLSSGHGESFFHVLTMWVLDGCNNSLEELPLLNCIAPTPLQSCFAESLWLYLFWQVLRCLLSSNAGTSAKEYVFFCTFDSGCTHNIFFLSRAGWTVPHGHCILTACPVFCFIPAQKWRNFSNLLEFKLV